MWDAQDQYWKGHEWNLSGSQPTLNFWLPEATTSNDYAKSNADARYYHAGGGLGRFDATQSCASLPNANEISWYCMYGDPRWDADKLWTTMGHLYKGGMWIKKKSVLQAEGHYNTEKSADNTTDMRTTWKSYSNYNSSISNSGVPSAAEANNYFYLPALGYYLNDQLTNVGGDGFFWSSTSLSYNSAFACYLHFASDRIYLHYGNREYGFRAQKFSYFGDN